MKTINMIKEISRIYNAFVYYIISKLGEGGTYNFYTP